MVPPNDNRIYSATYSNVRNPTLLSYSTPSNESQVPVYELTVAGNHVMRRRSDDWINATHILKVADFDKPARTRILEREVQKGVHEKVQGGYGKYQGVLRFLFRERQICCRFVFRHMDTPTRRSTSCRAERCAGQVEAHV